jgi:outer membrane lipase/esterase
MTRSIRRPLAAAAAALAVLAALPAHAYPYSGFYLFGDSLSDSGNVALALGQAAGVAQSISNTYIPGLPYPTDGTYFPAVFSNGPVWASDFAAAFGLQALPSLAGGTNFAFAGARVNLGMAGGADVPSLLEQYGAFVLGLQAAGQTLDANALYVVAGGGNDARDILTGLQSVAPADVPGAIEEGATSFAMGVDFIVEGLQAAGARHILVWDVPNLGVTPFVSALGATASFLGQSTSAAMSAALDGVLADDPLVRRLSVFGLSTQVSLDGAAFGLANTTDACGGAPAGTDCDTYFFWDGIHPTAAGHRLLAQQMQVAAIPEPSTYALMALGLVAVGFAARRRKAA